jgi:hypothetical protein
MTQNTSETRPMCSTKNAVRVAAFISIPKNASKTVLKMLQLGDNRDLDNTQSPVIYENHQRGQVLASRHNLTELFVFCFCRNPYDRCISWYEYHRAIEPYRNLTFREWVQLGMPHHFKKQNCTQYDEQGLSPLAQSIYVDGCKIDFIGRIENFDEDIKNIASLLNDLCKSRSLDTHFSYSPIRINTSHRNCDSSYYYDTKTRQQVYALLEQDFIRFDYPA